ncbi:MAG TPA: glycosyl hydrolase family 28-related protein, partial [Acetobacteraceae bacterium]
MSGSDYTQTPNLRLYKPVYDADAEQWGNHLNQNADTLDLALGTSGAGALFLPLAGGTVTGNLTVNGALAGNVTAAGSTASRALQDRFHDLRTPYDWGAKGDGTTDDTAALQAAFNQLGTEGGGRLYIPGSFRAVGALTVPASVEVYGDFTPTSQQYTGSVSYFQVGGSKLILGTSGITLGKSNILRNIMVIADSLPRGNPTTNAAAASLVTGMASAGTGITLSADNCLLDSVQVLGFNYGIYASGDPNGDRHMLRNIHGDCNNCIYLAHFGDTTRIQGAHFWPYLTANSPGTPTDLTRPGNGIWLDTVNCNTPVSQATVFGWMKCFLVNATSAIFNQCWSDGSGVLGSTGFATTGACGPVQLCACVAVATQISVHHAPT